jgi:CxxC motif-containing protein (DUF1111 family)
MSTSRSPERRAGGAWGPVLLLAVTALVLAIACAGSAPEAAQPRPPGAATEGSEPRGTVAAPSAEQLALSGGETTVFDDSKDAFARSAPNLSAQERAAFSVGNNFFNDNWVTAPASTDARDGLGPLFNAQSCSSCHSHDGRGQPPTKADDPELGLLLRLSVPDPAGGAPLPDPVYGGQLQDRSINGVAKEGMIRITTDEVVGTYADGSSYTLARPRYDIVDLGYGPPSPDLMISPRVAPAVFGVGLLEAVPEQDVVAAADPDDANGDGISGRPNRVVDPATGKEALGRLGWKANVATVEAQVTGAFHGDIGIASTLAPGQGCTPTQTACNAAIAGGTPEIDDAKVGRVVFYDRTLAVPARRHVEDPDNAKGAQLFTEIGCAACHTTELHTAKDGPIAALNDQTIRPYTDLLLHDMGEGLADDRPDGAATGTEWRTAPLWGIGLTKTVSRHTRFLHDGRARDLTEAVLWHGGEAAGAQQRFRELSAEDRRRLVGFLESL